MINEQLKHAQCVLTEDEIRKFWTAMTRSFPEICVNNGLVIDYNKDIYLRHINDMGLKLTKCHHLHVATPLFQYYYDPKNETPHHATALMLTKLKKNYILTFFDPKGWGSLKKKEEKYLLDKLAKIIEKNYKIKVDIKIYNGKNLQVNDNVGLCQLFSLRFLCEYIQQIQQSKKLSGINREQWLIENTDPDQIIKNIIKKDGKFNEKSLFKFWNTYFNYLKKQKC